MSMAINVDVAAIGVETQSAADPSDIEPASEELVALFQLGPEHVRRRWRALVGRPMPSGLGRHLTLRILAYHEQVHRHGDLDRASRRMLAEMAAASRTAAVTVGVGASAPATLAADGKKADAPRQLTRAPDLLRPGTLLAREHGGVLHRVLVGADGFSWQGQTYDSLSKVAFAITGTRWNGPRFFGLRDRPVQVESGKRQGRSNADANTARTVVGRGRASGAMRSPSQDATP